MNDPHEHPSSEPVHGSPAGVFFTPMEYGIIWAVLTAMPDAVNAPIRHKIEQFFAANGIPVEQLQAVAASARQQAEQYNPNTP